jgi:hypothetical protein
MRYEEEERRLREEHAESVASLEKTMTVHAAADILRANKHSPPQLFSVVQGMDHEERPMSRKRTAKTGNFLGFAQQGADPLPQGYAGVDKARDMLNEMLIEVNSKHDTTTMECKNFFESQCSLLETCRQDISAANAAAADARSRILGAQAEINVCETELPRLRYQLAEHERVCKKKIADLEESIKIVLDDIDVMVTVLEMTDCDANKDDAQSFLQMATILKCNCSGKTVFTFKHDKLHNSLAQLKSPELRDRVLKNLQMLAKSEPDIGFNIVANVTFFTYPEVPFTEVPPNPCAGIGFDDADVEGVGKCSVASNPMCYKLQDRFLAIQAGIEDTRDDLLEELEQTTTRCKMVKETLESDIEMYENKLANEQTLLAVATGQENEAGETGRMKNKEHGEMADEMFSTRDNCSTTLRTYESEQCALKKIRGELYKIKGDDHPAFFQDCEVSEWEKEACSADCGGGKQTLTRSVSVQPFKGAACPPLEGTQGCNLDPCPVQCKLAEWTGYSSCSAQCDGGVQTRTRAVEVQPKHGGDPCEETSQTISCNTAACSKDCVLADWTPWSNCSKACDGGSQSRARIVVEAEVGAGKCASDDSPERFQERFCNGFGCPKVKGLAEPIKCVQPIDIILLLDGSSSIQEDGWEKTKTFAKKFLGSFEGEGTDPNVAIILFSGPKTWSAYQQCVGEISPSTNMEETCGIKIVQYFTGDMEALKTTIDGLDWPSGTTLTSVALETAKSMITLSRPGVKTVVVTVTDGEPLSAKKTSKAAKKLKKNAQLLMVPVSGKGLTEEGVDLIADMASTPKDSNVVEVGDFAVLDDTTTIDHIIADSCGEDLDGFQCKNWCSQHSHSWAQKCAATWNQGACVGCMECMVMHY